MALSADRDLLWEDSDGSTIVTGTVWTTGVVYKGAILAQRANGLVGPASNAGATTRFFGIALAGATAAQVVSAQAGGRVRLPYNSITVANNQRLAYCADDENPSTATTLGPAIGTQQRVDGNYIWVDLGRQALTAQT